MKARGRPSLMERLNLPDEAWEGLKNSGSKHYKGGGIEPIDLYKSGGILRDFAIGNIIKYAYRNRKDFSAKINKEDMEKIIHYARMLQEG